VIGITPGFEALALSLCKSLAESGPVSVDDFDDEWTPAGQTYLDELVTGGLVQLNRPAAEEEGPTMIVLTGDGVALAQTAGPPAAGTAARP
jgi:hypothetical protein